MGLGWFPLEKLFGYLQPAYPQRDALILEAMGHPHADVRTEGYKHWGDLPESVARQRLRKGLGDSSAHIRMDSAKSLTSMRASEAEHAEDMALLRAQLAKEKDRDVVEALTQVIKRLE